jgi:hypothetical protein
MWKLVISSMSFLGTIFVSSSHSAKFTVSITVLFANTSFHQINCCLMCFIPFARLFLEHWLCLQIVPFTWSSNKAHSGWDLSTENVKTPLRNLLPTSGISRSRSLPHSQICISYRTCVRIRVRIVPSHSHACRKRRLNEVVLRMRPEKPRFRITTCVAR